MVRQLETKSATIATIGQTLPVGLDCGNGYAKTIIDLAEIRQPSYFLPFQKSRILDVPNAIDGGMVEYIDGDRPDLKGHVWLTGSAAYNAAPTSCLRVVDSQRGKLEYGLQLFLGAIATVQPRESWSLSVVASIQDAQVYGAELSSVLSGKHLVRLNNNIPTEVSVQVTRVVDEGVGAVVYARPSINPDGINLLLDIGQGTTILSVFGAKGQRLHRKTFNEGVERLIDSIATSLELRQQVGQEGDRQLIRAGIEAGSLQYGNGFNFESIYKTELRNWIVAVLAPAVKTASPWLANSSSFLAIGGGSQMPMVADLLAMKGIQPIKDGSWANARGLARIAYLGLRGGDN